MSVTGEQSLQPSGGTTADRAPLGGSGVNAGLVYAAASAATFASSGTFAASLLRAGWSPAAAVTMRIAIAALILTVPVVRSLRHLPATWRSGTAAVVVYGVVAVGGCQLCYFEAVKQLSVAVSLLLEYSGTLLVVAWMWARHHQRPGRLTLAGGVAAIAGLALVLDLGGSQRISLVGVVWGLGAAVGLAVYFVLSAGSPSPGDAHAELPPLVVAWGGMIVGAVTVGVVGAAGVVPMRAPLVDVTLGGHRVSWVVPVLGLSIVAAALAYVLGIVAARALGARLSSFVGLAEVLFAAVYAWLLLGEHLSRLQLVGGLLVLAGIAMVRAADGVASPPGRPAGADRLAVGAVE